MNTQIEITPPAAKATAFIDSAQKTVPHSFAILYGALAPAGGVLKLSGAADRFEGTAHVFDSEADAVTALKGGDITPNTAIIIRGKADMALIIDAVAASRVTNIALISDGSFIGQTHKSIIVSHCAPSAQNGGAIGRIQDGDIITIDALTRRIETTADLSTRKPTFFAPARGYQGHPALEKYARVMTAPS